jgi:MoaA/NifB/PqqE/SkfB family radical SAM enzyme
MATEPDFATYPPFPAGVDIELTSRCNAHCTFCPREETPHQGLIDEATFSAALGRAVEYRDALLVLHERQPGYLGVPDGTMWLSFCGMGEPLLHPRVVEYVARVTDAGLRPIINTNGALLSPELAAELLDAGLSMACINVGEVDDEYEAVYKLPFERTRANVEHFIGAAGDRCGVSIALVDHRGDPAHAAAMRAYWSNLGARAFMPFELVNRAGALQVGEQLDVWAAYGDDAQALLRDKGGWTSCWVPFLYPFVGYDGNYYLCSSDWRKQVNLGNVFDDALADLIDEKLEQVRGRSPICPGCTHEPANELAWKLARAAGDAPEYPGASTPEELLAALDHFAGCVEAMRTHLPHRPTDLRTKNRRLIPVRS